MGTEESWSETDHNDVKTKRKVGTDLGWAPQRSQPTTAIPKQDCYGEAFVQRMNES